MFDHNAVYNDLIARGLPVERLGRNGQITFTRRPTRQEREEINIMIASAVADDRYQVQQARSRMRTAAQTLLDLNQQYQARTANLTETKDALETTLNALVPILRYLLRSEL